MGAIQQAINQGIDTAVKIGSIGKALKDAEAREQERKDKAKAEHITKLKAQGEALGEAERDIVAFGKNPKGITPTSDENIENINKTQTILGDSSKTYRELFELTGDKKYYNEALNAENAYRLGEKSIQSIYDQRKAELAMKHAQEQLAAAKQLKEKRKSLLDLPLTIGDEDFGTLRDLPVDMRKQARGELKNGRK